MRALAASVGVLFATVACTRPADLSGTPASVEAHRLWSGEDVDFLTGDISPDGRVLSDINWTSGDLGLVDLATGTIRDATGEGYGAGRYAWTSAFSSDGTRVAVSWFVEAAGRHELRLMSRDGSDSRVLVPTSPTHYAIDPLDWSSSDDAILVAVQTPDRLWQIGLVSVETGSLRIVKSLGWQAPGGGHAQGYPEADVSPDGRFVAYDYPADLGQRSRDIYVIALADGSERTLVSGAGSDRLLGWLPDGSGILFYSDRTGTPGIWRLAVQHGSPAGAPQLVRADVRGLIPLGFTRDGYAYGVDTEAERVHTATIDPDTGRVSQPPAPLDDDRSRRSLAADWSPDGRRLAYVVQDPWPDPAETVVIRSASGERVRSIPLPAGVHTSSGTLRWVTEGTVVTFAYDTGHEGIYSIDLAEGRVSRVPLRGSAERGAIKWFEAGPGGGTIFLVRPAAAGGGVSELVAIDGRTGRERVIGPVRAAANSLAVSADGAALAYVARGDDPRTSELRVTMAATGDTRTIRRAPRGSMGPPVAWTADGARLLFARPEEKGDRILWSIAVRGEDEPVRVLPCCRGNDVRVHPDGRRIAFTAGTPRGELWILKGF